MPNTCSTSGVAPISADGDEVALSPALIALTGGATQPLGAVSWMRFATSNAPSGAGTVADLFMLGGVQNPGQWQLVTYTCTAGALSAAATLSNSDCTPANSASGTMIGQAPALLALSGGVQGTYSAGVPWFRFATSFSPANGQTVADLVMIGGLNDRDRWQVVIYTVTGGVLS